MPSGPSCVVRPLAGSPLQLRHVLAYRDTGPVANQAAQFTELAVEAHREAAAASPAYTNWLASSSTVDDG
jgi:hypothetical protein